MPCKSWSLPAKLSCPAAVFGEGTICSSCYAAKGNYLWNAVQRCQHDRFHWATQSMKSAEGTEEFVSTMSAAIAHEKNPYFRVHDSGDLFSPAYTRAWAEVARRQPAVSFWFPTRTYRFLEYPKWGSALGELSILPNVTLRPSALYFDTPPPEVQGMAAGTTATVDGFTCPAPLQGNQCGECRVCWDEPDTPVSYHKH